MPAVLVASGLDPSGGAGLLVDTRVVSALGARPVGVLTAQTVQDTHGLREIQPIDHELLEAQLAAVLGDIELRAIKLGLLAGPEIVRVLDAAFAQTRAPVVWDPIAGPTRGSISVPRALLEDALRRLCPHIAVITPNVRELEMLARVEIATLADAIDGAQALAQIAQVAVLVKGGHLLDGPDSVDVLIHSGGTEQLRAPRIAGPDVHGTGCALSSAIAAHLALGANLLDACRAAKAYVAERITTPVHPGRGAPAVL